MNIGDLNISALYMGDIPASAYMGDQIVWPTENPVPVYSAMPLTLEITSAGSIMWAISGDSAASRVVRYVIEDSGGTVQDSGSFTSSTAGTGWTFGVVDVGTKIKFYGNNPNGYAKWSASTTTPVRYYYPHEYNTMSGSTAGFIMYGNIMSLIDGDNFPNYQIHALSGYEFCNLFRDCTGLTSAENMIIPNDISVGPMTCLSLFKACTSLQVSPQVNATAATIGTATTNGASYTDMFMNCSSLNQITCLLPMTGIGIYRFTTGVPTGSTGNFYRAIGSTWYTGVNGMPNGWAVINIQLNA